MIMSVLKAAEVMNGTLSGDDVMFNGVSINTREDCQDVLFIALKGENFDAHDFIDKAAVAGAAAVLVERDVSSTLPTIKVEDTHQALKKLAAWWRSQFAIPVLGITGSVGKTTVKEMLGSIMAELGEGVVTYGNLNNEIGVPLTLLRLDSEHRYAVVEMGMNHAGEIARLTDIAQPTVALVNNAGAAHLEGLGSVEAVAHAKGEIFSGLTDDGVAIINLDDDYANHWKALSKNHSCITFGLNASADVHATYRQEDHVLKLGVTAFEERVEITLHSFGEHSVRNALAAIAAALAANLPLASIAAGLEGYAPIKGRLDPKQIGSTLLFDDTYNANPTSMQAAIRVLESYDNNLLIVGDMAELGKATVQEHRHIGEFARHHGIDQLMACGEFAKQVVEGYGERGLAFSTQEKLLEYLKQNDLSARAALVKGSRSAKMENVVEALTQQLGGDEEIARGAN